MSGMLPLNFDTGSLLPQGERSDISTDVTTEQQYIYNKHSPSSR